MKRLLLIIPCLLIASMVNAQQEPAISDTTWIDGFNDSQFPQETTNYEFGWYINHYPYDTSGHDAVSNSELVVNCEGADTAEQAGIGTYGAFWNPSTSSADTIDIMGSKKAMIVMTNHSDTANAYINFNVQAVVNGTVYNANPRTTGNISINPNTTDTLIYKFHDAYDYGAGTEVNDLDSIINFFTAVNLDPSSPNNSYDYFNDTITIDSIQIGGVNASAPTNVTADTTDATEITVNWSEANPVVADSFQVRRSTDGGSTWSAVAWLMPGNESYVDSNLDSATTYTYQIRAYDGGINKYYPSSTASATTADETTGLSSAISSSDVSVYPNPASDVIQVEGVEGDVSTTVSNAVGQVVASGNNTVNVSGLDAGIYFVTVEANGEVVKKSKVVVE